MRPVFLVPLILLPLFGVGCASDRPRADAGPTPAAVVASGLARTAVHWGGQIVGVRNLRDRTLIEVLAFPLNSAGRPLPAESPQGRFLVDKAGYLEAREYAPGRLLEVRGQLNGFRSGQVGEVQYRYPVVVSERLLLWPGDHYGHSRRASPRVNFGIGVSNHGGGVGVGIGF